MNDTFESVIKHFEEAELTHHADREAQFAWAVISTSKAVYNVQVRVTEDTLWVVLHHPLRVPEEQRAALAELVVRMAPENTLVRLEMDFDEGHLRTRGRIVFDEAVGLDPDDIQGPILSAVVSMDWFHPSIVAVLHQGMSPKEAIELLENDEDDPENPPPPPHAGRFNLPLPEDEAQNN